MNTVLFHGTADARPRLGAVVEADVVLQPYHPIVQAGTYADWFPLARRFVYVNPTAADRAAATRRDRRHGLRRPARPMAAAAVAAPRERSTGPSPTRWSIGRAARLDGIFVDDLDRLLVRRRGGTSPSATSAGSPPRPVPSIYVNRAFAILDALPGSRPSSSRTSTASWFRRAAPWLDEVVLPALTRARRRGVAHPSARLRAPPALRAGRTCARVPRSTLGQLDRPAAPPVPGPVVLVANDDQAPRRTSH